MRAGRADAPAGARSSGSCSTIRTMWFGLMALTISQFFTGALGYWGIEFFKRAFDLNATKAGAFAPLIGAGAVLGLVAGGEVADRLLRRGDVNARVHVTAAASVLAERVPPAGVPHLVVGRSRRCASSSGASS